MAIKRPRPFFKTCVFFTGLIPLGWLAFALWSDTVNATIYMTADPVQKLNRELGDWALIFIIITIAVRPFADLTKKPGLVAYRRMIGLYAFFYALLHVSSYLGIDLQLLVPLAVTSTKGMMKRLGSPRWKRLHYLVYLIAILGALHFFMMTRADFSRPILYAVVILVLLAYRGWTYQRKTRPKKPTAPTTEAA